jgi:hypothetical protein
MGTSKPGRYMNTKGSARTMSQFSLVHASEGKFTRPQRPTDPLKLVSGGHGQKGMNLLDKYDIAYNIVKIYPNGVRVGVIKTNGQIGIVFPDKNQP